MWLMQDRGFDDVMSDIRALNGPFRVMAPAIQAGFTTRLKSEQASVRKTVIRMDTMRRTSYVAAGYLIAEVTAVLLVVVLVLTDMVDLAPTLCLIGLISYLLFYLVGLIRDLDNPFEYRDGKPGAADVNLDVLERNEDRLRALARRAGPGTDRRRAGLGRRGRGAAGLIGASHDRGPWRSVHGDPGEGADRHGSLLPPLLLASVLVLAGCGGDDDSGAADQPTASRRPRARRRATPVCRGTTTPRSSCSTAPATASRWPTT